MKKFMTREQAQTSKDRAARFVLNVKKDPDGAQAIEDESLDDWVERKKVTLTNPHRNRRIKSPLIGEGENNMAKRKPTMAELLEENTSLKQENKDLQDENDDLNDQLDQVADIVASDDEEDYDEDDGEEDDGEDDDNQD